MANRCLGVKVLTSLSFAASLGGWGVLVCLPDVQRERGGKSPEGDVGEQGFPPSPTDRVLNSFAFALKS